MTLLQEGHAFLRSVLPTVVEYIEPGQGPVSLKGTWANSSYDSRGNVGIGAERFDGKATFDIEYVGTTNTAAGNGSLINPVNRRAIIRKDGQEYRIAHVEPVQQAIDRLHLERIEKGGATPTRPGGRR